MGARKPNRQKGMWKPHAKRFERVSEIRQKTQKVRSRYQVEMRHLDAEIRKSTRSLAEMDAAHRQGKPIDPKALADALRIRNTATARRDIVLSRLQQM